MMTTNSKFRTMTRVAFEAALGSKWNARTRAIALDGGCMISLRGSDHVVIEGSPAEQALRAGGNAYQMFGSGYDDCPSVWRVCAVADSVLREAPSVAAAATPAPAAPVVAPTRAAPASPPASRAPGRIVATRAICGPQDPASAFGEEQAVRAILNRSPSPSRSPTTTSPARKLSLVAANARRAAEEARDKEPPSAA